MEWLRLYHSILDSLSLKKMSDTAQRDYFLLLCIANEHRDKTGENTGSTGLNVEDCSLRASRSSMLQSVDEMCTRGLAQKDRNGIVFCTNWTRFQPDSDNRALAKRRERNRQSKITGDQLFNDDVATSRRDNVVLEGEREVEVDSQTDINQERLSERSRARALAMQQLPVPFRSHLEIARSRNVDVRLEHAKWLDWIEANEAQVKGHAASFRNWLRRANPERKNGTPQRKETALDVGRRIDADLQRQIDEENATQRTIGEPRHA